MTATVAMRTEAPAVCSLLGQAASARLGAGGLPYIVIENALPPDYYDELAAAFPSAEAVAGHDDLPSNKAFRRSAREVMQDPFIPAIWRDFFTYHVSREFFDEVCRLWADEITRFHPTLEREFGKPLDAFTIGVREPGKHGNPANQAADVMLDCQFSINSPVRERSSVRGPHLDSPYKLFAGLFYMRSPHDTAAGGDLEFYRLKHGRYPVPKPGRVDPARVELVETIPYRANTLVMFLNTPQSIHGVTPREVTEVPRRYINLLGECYRGRSHDFFITPNPTAPPWWRKAMRLAHQYLPGM